MGLSFNEFLLEIRVSTCFNQLHRGYQTHHLWSRETMGCPNQHMSWVGIDPPNETTLQALVEHGQKKKKKIKGTPNFYDQRHRSLPVPIAL